MLERMWSNGNTHPLLVGMQTCTITLKISMVVSHKMGINLPQDPAMLLLAIYPKMLNHTTRTFVQLCL